jgi:hypothetical protein
VTLEMGVKSKVWDEYYRVPVFARERMSLMFTSIVMSN